MEIIRENYSPSFRESAPTEVEFYIDQANLLLKGGEKQYAIALFHRALVCEPDSQNALLSLGKIYRDNKEYDKAYKCFTAAYISAESAEALYGMAEISYLAGNDELAINQFMDSILLVHEQEMLLFECYKNIGNIYVRSGDFDMAEDFYNKAFTLNPQSDVLAVNYGTLAIQRGDYDDAINRFRKAVELNRKNDRAWVGLAMIHNQMGDFHLAWANLKVALDHNFENKTALLLASQWAIRDKDFDYSISAIERFLSQDGESNHEDVVVWLCELLIAAKRQAKARDIVHLACCQFPQNQRLDHLQKSLSKTGY